MNLHKIHLDFIFGFLSGELESFLVFEALIFGGVLGKALDSDFGIWKTSIFGVSGLYFWASSMVHWTELECLLFTLRLDVLAAEEFALSEDFK